MPVPFVLFWSLPDGVAVRPAGVAIGDGASVGVNGISTAVGKSDCDEVGLLFEQEASIKIDEITKTHLYKRK
jgi:hypothetical protein